MEVRAHRIDVELKRSRYLRDGDSYQARVVITSAAKRDVAMQFPALCPKVERWVMIDADAPDGPFEPFDDRLQFLQGSWIIGREFQEDDRVFNIALELVGFVDCRLQAASLFEDLLGPVLVVPEIRFTNLCF